MCCPPRVVYDGLHFLNTQGSLVRCCQEIGFFFFFACFSVFCGGEVLPGNSFFFACFSGFCGGKLVIVEVQLS